jgi:ABC-type glycerol-3-phosphate transport system substrate-binding protein
MEFIQDFWNVPVYNELLAVTEQRLGEALDGVKTPKQALDTISIEHDRIFKEAGLAK